MKPLTLLCCALFFYCCNSFSQSLFGWKHYYAPTYGAFDMGNYIAFMGSEEIVQLDKASQNITRIPFPAEMRNINPHNTLYFDTLFQEWHSCGLSLSNGPGNTLIIKSCVGHSFMFNGTTWLPFDTFQGFNVTDIYFLPNSGGSAFFTANSKLYKYDGTTLSYYDLSNSPYDPNTYYYSYVNAADDIFLMSNFNIAIYHNGGWMNYDTTYFNSPYVVPQGSIISPSGNLTFFMNGDSTLRTFDVTTGTWITNQVPAAFLHPAIYNLQISTAYDVNGDLWLASDSVLMRFDGNQFYDHFPFIAGIIPEPSGLNVQCFLANDNLLLNGYNKYVYNTTSHTLTPYNGDDHAVLTGDCILPSMKDQNGNLWFGEASWGQMNGLLKYDGTFHPYPLEAHGIDGAVYCIVQDTGNSIVFGYGDLSSGGPVRLVNDSIYQFIAPGFTMFVQNIVIDGNHHYWMGGGGAGVPLGLAELDNNTLSFYPNPASSDIVYAIGIDSLNHAWVSYDSYDGVYMFDGTSWTNYSTANSPLPNDTVISILRQPNTDIMWFCTSGGFAVLDHGNWTVYNASNSPVPSDHAESVYWGDDGGMWFCTQGGFAHYIAGNWATYTVFNSPLDNSDVESIVIDNDCNAWICTEHGITFAHATCASPQDIYVNGFVTQHSGAPAPNAMVKIYKLNAAGNDVIQVDNLFTDSAGHYSYFTRDPGSLYFSAIESESQFPGQLSAYVDTARVIQESQAINVVAGNIYTANIRLAEKNSSPGNILFHSQVVSSTERTGSIRILLFNNGVLAAEAVTNVNGTFDIPNLSPGNYSVWVDKPGLNNAIAPVIAVDTMGSADNIYFELYPDRLVRQNVKVNDNSINNSVTVYPNPFTLQMMFSISSSSAENVKLEVTTISGVVVYTSDVQLHPGANKFPISTSAFTPGVYFYHISGSGKSVYGKVLKL